jgi:hypothetical protein
MVQRKKTSDNPRASTRRKAPPATDPGLVTEETPLSEGDSVQIEWGGSWWPGKVLSVEEDGTVRIHYDGYDNSWDENVPRTRLRLPGEAPTGGGAAQAATNPGPVEADPLRAALSTRPVTERTRLAPGDALHVEWGGRWWAGSVVRVEDDGRVRIHYEGWASSWDETVPRSRLALPSTGPRTVSVVLDNAQALSGTLMGSVGDFLILLREGDTVQTFINRQKVLYLDVRQTD